MKIKVILMHVCVYEKGLFISRSLPWTKMDTITFLSTVLFMVTMTTSSLSMEVLVLCLLLALWIGKRKVNIS